MTTTNNKTTKARRQEKKKRQSSKKAALTFPPPSHDGFLTTPLLMDSSHRQSMHDGRKTTWWVLPLKFHYWSCNSMEFESLEACFSHHRVNLHQTTLFGPKLHDKMSHTHRPTYSLFHILLHSFLLNLLGEKAKELIAERPAPYSCKLQL